jgi:hypothetical protein
VAPARIQHPCPHCIIDAGVPGEDLSPVDSQPLHSPDLMPADFFLLPELKKELAGSTTYKSHKNISQLRQNKT